MSSERVVGIQVGTSGIASPLMMEVTEDWVEVRAMTARGYARACRMLYHMHLQYNQVGIPHRLVLATDAEGMEFIQGLAVPRTLAEDYLFPKLLGLAEQADSTPGVH